MNDVHRRADMFHPFVVGAASFGVVLYALVTIESAVRSADGLTVEGVSPACYELVKGPPG